MAKCASCGIESSNTARFCASCGRPVSNTDDVATLDFATVTSPLPPKPPSSRSSASRNPSSAEYQLGEGRFLPGRLIAGRYRIIALLGKGGMCAVYRPHHLTLGQPLPPNLFPDK